MHIQILLTMFSLPMPMTNITTNIFMKMDNTAIRFLDVVYFLGMAVNKIVMIICTVELYPHRLYRIQQQISIYYIHFDWIYLGILVYLFILFICSFIYLFYSLDAYYRSPQGASAGYLYGYYPYAYHRGYFYG